MAWYALCNGEGLPEFGSCRRNADNQPLGTIGEHQAWMMPLVRNGSCFDYFPDPKADEEDKL